MNNTRWFLKPIRAAALLLVMSAAAVLATWAQSAQPAANSIEAINVAGQRDGSIVVRVTLKQPLADPPAGFTINNPPRIAFDFPGTSNALGKNTQEVGDGDLRNMNIVQAGERTRLVMNLSKLLAYDTKVDGRNVIITLQPVATGTAATPVTLHFAEAKVADTRHSLRDVSFRRGPNGEGRIIVDLSDNAVGIDLRLQGRGLIIDFQNTALPK
ncbi:MAG: AMIN domain-containing protein, partial [Pseudomonadota bacterium]